MLRTRSSSFSDFFLLDTTSFNIVVVSLDSLKIVMLGSSMLSSVAPLVGVLIGGGGSRGGLARSFVVTVVDSEVTLASVEDDAEAELILASVEADAETDLEFESVLGSFLCLVRGRFQRLALNLARRSSRETACRNVRTMVLDVVNGSLFGTIPTESTVSLFTHGFNKKWLGNIM